ncbi:ATP-binding protein [Streptomyces sp. NPDC005438]|uniref:sensor histidine kinase n=1 Tax=Streptomyces sp. NPDC005438 TaxID=3156880 RepID=UPI0033A7D2E0
MEPLGTGSQRAQRFMLLATLLYRVSHLVVGLSAVLQHQRGEPVQWAVLAVAGGCTALVYGGAPRRGWFTRWTVWVDVLVTGATLPFVAYLWGGAQESASLAWVMVLGGSCCSVATIALDRTPAVVAVLLVGVTHVVGYGLVDAATTVLGGHLNSLLFSAVLAAVFWRYLCRQGAQLDEAGRRAVAAEARRARYAERISHFRSLHDTALATLTAIASGKVDANTPQMRERCAREAAYLRRLVERGLDDDGEPDEGGEGGGTAIFEALEAAVRSSECLGLKVTARYHRLPRVPTSVVPALAEAVTEALHNVRRHSGSGHAYVTASGAGEGIEVTVVDQGGGFDPGAVTAGMGLRHSIRARVHEIGGRTEVDSALGEGTRVELRWPA